MSNGEFIPGDAAYIFVVSSQPDMPPFKEKMKVFINCFCTESGGYTVKPTQVAYVYYFGSSPDESFPIAVELLQPA